ncbi:neutral zinc metallopeptidase [Streptomyces sp. NPDC059193]|uniref:neutral zinc metallopeptidase n=1 Tax=Streptomyces sp. NPDC059193 TaxID=3346763 RepID=UPI0036978A64
MAGTLRTRMCTALAAVLLAMTGGGYAYGLPATVSEDTLEQDIAAAAEGVDAFWQKHWSEFFTESYVSPTVLGLYDGTAPDAPTCGGEKLEPGNAFYCIPEDYVAWDINLMNTGHAAGDAYVYFIVAHEWGHAVQSRLASPAQDIGRELQADCFAGAELQGASQDETINFEAGDQEELAAAIASVSDTLPWSDSADHGSVEQRIHAYNKGVEGGVEDCLPLTTPR